MRRIARAKQRNFETKEYVLKRDHLTPGQKVSVDQYKSSVRGRLSTTRGREIFGHQYGGGTIFCDHASGLVECHHQVSLRGSATVIFKNIFERSAKSCGVPILSSHGDNGIFKDEAFMKDIDDKGQDIDFSGIGAKFQNGVAERSIRTVTEKARSMMQHSFLHWPEAFQVALWPFALDYACWLHNHIPHKSSRLAPIEIFCGTKVACKHTQRARVWGSPAYVLSPTLQDGHKILKWAPRARRGQFLGHLKTHSSIIALIRNLQTGSISSQFHVVFDELFTTVHSVDDDDTDIWVELFTGEREYYGPSADEEDDPIDFPDLDPGWLPAEHAPLIAPPAPDDVSVATVPTSNIAPPTPPVLSDIEEDDPEDEDDSDDADAPDDLTPEAAASDAAPDAIPRRQSKRIREGVSVPSRFSGEACTSLSITLTPNSRSILGIVSPISHGDIFLHSLDWDGPFRGSYTALAAQNSLHIDPLPTRPNGSIPSLLARRPPTTTLLLYVISVLFLIENLIYGMTLWISSWRPCAARKLFGRFFALRCPTANKL